MPNNMPVMPLVFLVLLLLPIRLSGLQMKGLAFFLWFLGGLILCGRGAVFLFSEPHHPGLSLLVVIVLVALCAGWAKGQFVLSKTSRRNIERIDGFVQPMRPIAVYSARSWGIIAIMVLISVSLTIFNVPPLWRGGINLTIGAALIISSMAYLRALVPSEPASFPPDGRNIGPGVGP